MGIPTSIADEGQRLCRTSSMLRKARVMIVDDCRVVREFLRHLIAQDARLEVVACVESGEEALQALRRISPDVISLDIRLPGMNGLEVTQRIMSERPTPIVVVSASVEAEGLKISINALKAGALAVVEKPVGLNHVDYQQLAHALCTQLAIMSQVKVVRQRIDRGLQFTGKTSEKAVSPAEIRRLLNARTPSQAFRILGVAASTGGPRALQSLLSSLGAGFPLPIVVVQHIADGFMDGFISWLASVAPLPVTVAKQGETPEPGHVYVAPGNRHVRIDAGRLTLDDGQPIRGQRPSATVLFESMALDLGPAALAVLLTGMGDDGAAGLKEVCDAGGYTVAEDESTAVVFGMPRAAIALDAVCECLPLDAIGARLDQLTQRPAACR
jgi:two-component system chemotaxis response regulator CheB